MDQQTGMLRLGCDTRLDREIKEDYLFHMKAEDTAGHTVSYQMRGGGAEPDRTKSSSWHNSRSISMFMKTYNKSKRNKNI